jgi:hypothetical protein
MPKRTISTLTRRMEFIAYLRTVGEGPECITWPWSRSPSRYASTVDNWGKQVSVHRWVYEQINGPLNGREACHTCDNPPCVRPSHLWAGTHGDNMRDAYRKGRKKANINPRPGVAHHNARLTVDQVYAIRRLCANGVSHSVVAETFGVSRVTVTQINRRVRWKHLPEETN